LTSVFQPFSVDDAYGRKECVPEVQHNQLTQWQGIYSPRYWWPTMGVHLIAANLDCDVTVMDWPTLDEFEAEVKKGYDYVGISFIHASFLKFKKMAERVRELSPNTKIIAGGFGATISQLPESTEVDYVCQGEGIRYMRDLLGQDPEFEFNHPHLHAELIRFMGVPVDMIRRVKDLFSSKKDGFYTNILVTGLGCTNGCEFCASSHFFNCKFLPFMRSGREIYDNMARLTKMSGANGYMFVGDENFLLDKKRAEELWKLQRDSEEEYVIRLIFASIDRLEQFDPEMLAEMDIDHVWVGLESLQFPFPKTKGRDVRKVLDGLRSVGIKLILSSILFLDDHDQENIQKDIDFHISLNPEHSQFAGLAAPEGTPLYERLDEEGRILHDVPLEERHAFKQIWFSHPNFSLYESEIFQRDAYLRDLHELGPSSFRTMMTNARALPKLEKMKSPRIKVRAKRLREEATGVKPLLLAGAMVAENEQLRKVQMDMLDELQEICGKLTPLDRAKAEVLANIARVKMWKDRNWESALQPKSRTVRYPA